MGADIITIDGPAGTGKSTVASQVALRLKMPHLDTGAYYRAATVAALRVGADVSDAEAVTSAVRSADFDLVDGRTLLDGNDVTNEIRSAQVTDAVSDVSAHPAVRRALVDHQRAWVDARGGRSVVEGRDTGSVVFPKADLKVYLDAAPEVRARRRALETGEDEGVVLADLLRRDRFDSTRATSPLQVPGDATVIDTTSMSVAQVVERIVELAGLHSDS